VGVFGGILVIIGVVIVAGGIAYIGDRVGHQVGRKRLTLFGLRPKYTSTIVAVGTGMMIALTIELLTLAISGYARAAFFHLSELNNQVADLQNKADELDRRVHETHVIVNVGQLMYQQFLVITPSESQDERMKALSLFFDAAVASANRTYEPLGLKASKARASDQEIEKQLEGLFNDQKLQGFLLRGPVIMLVVADKNLFINDGVHFEFRAYLDQLIFRAHQPIASVEIDGGTVIQPATAYGEVVAAVQDAAITAGMPPFFAQNPLSSITPAQVEQTADEIQHGKGKYYLIARASVDVYPHTGGLPVEFILSRKPK
jgi:hypothetical protein